MSKHNKVSLHIIALFLVAILYSFIPELFGEFFGDEYCTGIILDVESGNQIYYHHYGGEHQTPEYHWGWRHWLFMMMGLSLTAIQIFRIIAILEKSEDGK